MPRSTKNNTNNIIRPEIKISPYITAVGEAVEAEGTGLSFLFNYNPLTSLSPDYLDNSTNIPNDDVYESNDDSDSS